MLAKTATTPTPFIDASDASDNGHDNDYDYGNDHGDDAPR